MVKLSGVFSNGQTRGTSGTNGFMKALRLTKGEGEPVRGGIEEVVREKIENSEASSDDEMWCRIDQGESGRRYYEIWMERLRLEQCRI
jgi:hypothetical protein